MLFVDLEGLASLLERDHFLCDLIDVLLAQAIASRLIDPVEADFPIVRRRWIERDRAGNEGQAQEAFPIGARNRHWNSKPTQYRLIRRLI
jgi:hypothetical protein